MELNYTFDRKQRPVIEGDDLSIAHQASTCAFTSMETEDGYPISGLELYDNQNSFIAFVGIPVDGNWREAVELFREVSFKVGMFKTVTIPLTETGANL